MENLFIKIIDLLKFEWYTKNLTLIFFSITILGFYDIIISPIFNKISFIYSIIDDISNSKLLLNTWNLLLLTPYFIAMSSFLLGLLYLLLFFKYHNIDLDTILFNYIGKSIKILLLFYPLSIILLCLAIHNSNVINNVFGLTLLSIGVALSIAIGFIALVFSLFTGWNIPHKRTDVFK
ncbi:hypothetical protein [Staphylococcus simulans]|nr:hypothetical protein BU053_02800 [Staphylococcus simulans]